MRYAVVNLFVVLALCGTVLAGFSESLIKCKVCEKAIEHIWTKGAELRRLCKHHPPGPDRDERCDFDEIHPHAVEQMSWGACEALPVTYKAIHESEFDLILHDDPQHPVELAAALKDACIKFLHDEHGAEHIGFSILQHLRHNQVTSRILPILKKDFCTAACVVEERPTPLRPERLYDDHDDL